MPANPKTKKPPRRQVPPGWQDPLRQQQPLVSHTWLLRALGVTLAVALVCAYLTLCLLFYQGSWQLLFHPSQTVVTTPASLGVPFEAVSFDATETGQPQLTAWWIPADPGARYTTYTLVCLHGGSGSLSDTLPQLKTLHALGISLFAIDYRGFGKSMPLHPSEQSVYEDADAAIAYLTGTRKLDAKTIILYGEGLGATIAAETALRHPDLAGLILLNPAPPALQQIAADRRTGLIPVRLLFSDRFELAPKLEKLSTPKLLLQQNGTAPDPALSPRMKQLFQQSVPPKTFAELPPNPDEQQYLEILRRFLDELR
jgi:uncharacterized protein